ncbi:MAG: hypothetical protein ABIP42_11700 [Planctomycetota bacterium]
MTQESVQDRCRRFVREHERGLIVAWLFTMVLVLGIGFVWGIRFRGFERVVDAYEARWPARVERGQKLFEAGRYEEAASFLEHLDADFPARSVKHRFDREREKLLTALARSYVKLDKKRRALEACERLVAFDPRNWQNYSTQAEAALAFAESDLAKQALDLLLAIHPTHLPSLQARIQLAVDASAFAQVPPLWRAYDGAYRLATIDFSLGEAKVSLEVPTDGLPHRFEVPFELAANFRGEARLSTHGWSIDLREISFTPPIRIGIAQTPTPTVIEAGVWTVSDAQELASGSIAARNVNSMLRRELAGPAAGCARASFEIVAYKACTDSLWRMVEASFKNMLLWDELEVLRARRRIGGCLEAGSVFDD